MKKPNFHYFRFANFLADTNGMKLHVIGAFQLLCAHAWQRWQPDLHPFPFLPNDEKLLAKLCNRTRNWRYMRDEVMALFTLEDDKWFYAPHKEDALSLTGHQKRKSEKKEQRSAKNTSANQEPSAAKPSAEQRDELEQKAIKTLNGQSATSEPDTQRPWDEAPAAEPGKLVYGLQGYRAAGWPSMNKLLRHPTKLKETECVMWNVTDAGVKQYAVKVIKDGRAFNIKLPDGQIIKAE
jgi:uncharacterized protein YdaU (DUF1376 family)